MSTQGNEYNDGMYGDDGLYSQNFGMDDDAALMEAVRSAAEMLAAEGLGNMVNMDTIQRPSAVPQASDNETEFDQTDYETDGGITDDMADISLSQPPNRPLLRGRRKRVSYAEDTEFTPDGLLDDDEDSNFSVSDTSSDADYHLESIQQMVREKAGFRNKRGKKGKAKGRSKKKEKQYSREVQQLLGIANSLYIHRQLTESFTVLCDAIRIDANCSIAWSTMALIRKDQGKTSDAIHLYTVAAHLTTDDTVVWEQLYGMYMTVVEENAQAVQDGNMEAQAAYDEAVDQALDCLKHIVTISPTNKEAWARRLQMLEAKEDYLSMARAYRTMLRIDPYNMQTIRDAATMFAKRRDDVERPIEWFVAAIEFYNKQAMDLAEQAAGQAQRHALAELADQGLDENVDLGAVSDEEGQIDEEWAAYFAANPDKTVPMEDLGGYSYSDLNMLAELRLLRSEYEMGLVDIKRGARFVQGRGREYQWEDKELVDKEDDEYPVSADGGENGLPIELRIKLGQFRLLLGSEDVAKKHIDALHMLDTAAYEDLYTDVAETYAEVGHVELAVEIYEQLVAHPETNQPSVWERLAKCYRDQGDLTKACQFALDVVQADPSDIDMRLWLGEVYEDMGNVELAYKMISDVEEIQQAEGIRETDRESQILAARRATAYASRRRKNADEERHRYLAAMRSAEVVFKKLDMLWPRIENGDAKAIAEYCESAMPLYNDWRHTRAFYPSERQRPFRRYRTIIQTNLENDAQEGEAMESTSSGQAAVQRQMDRMRRRLSRKQSKPAPSAEPHSQLAPPTTFRGILFTRWLDMFLMLGKCMAQDTSHGPDALLMLDTVFQSNVFLHDTKSKRMLKLTMLAIAIHCSLYDQLYELTRWWCGPRPNTSVVYKIFAYAMAGSSAATSMLTSSNVYKFVRRQLDFINNMYYSRAHVAEHPVDSMLRPFAQTEDDSRVVVVDGPNQRRLAKSDLAALHSVSAHVMLVAPSIATSIVQYTMSLSLCPNDASTALHLGVAYLHQAARRTEQAPRSVVLQAMTYIERYAELRCMQEKAQGGQRGTVVTQEIAYNFARAFHFLGMLDLACSYYERVFELPVSETACDASDLRSEAAYNLASIYIASGSVLRAKALLKTHCTV
ncbi:transcription factor TFIIIC subunit tfc4 [Coemansia sp. RSA 1199]|nr:transcription factor TFIIIC subunit tfc4 [Coemansia sp. RSA 1199]